LDEQVEHPRAVDCEPDVVDATAVAGRPRLAGQAVQFTAGRLEAEQTG